MKNPESGATQVSRRQLLQGLLGIGAACGATAAGSRIGVSAAIPQASSRPIIRTILKDVDPNSLGVILFHEHTEMSSTFGLKGGPGAPQPTQHFTENFEVMVDELKAAKNDGVTCIVDAGHADQGRRVPYVRQLSIHSGMPMVVSGGYHSQPSYPPEVHLMSEDDLVEEFLTYAKAERWGALGEIGISAQITPDERKVARAIAKTHLRTALPIFTHTANGQSALEQLDIYESAGVKPDRIVIGHLGNLNDATVKVHKEIAQRGAYVGFDRVGRDPKIDEMDVPMVVAMIEAGYADRLMFASDGGATDDILKAKGGPGYARAVTVFLPKLRKTGVKDDVIHRITVDNPRRFLQFVPKA